MQGAMTSPITRISYLSFSSLVIIESVSLRIFNGATCAYIYIIELFVFKLNDVER